MRRVIVVELLEVSSDMLLLLLVVVAVNWMGKRYFVNHVKSEHNKQASEEESKKLFKF